MDDDSDNDKKLPARREGISPHTQATVVDIHEHSSSAGKDAKGPPTSSYYQKASSAVGSSNSNHNQKPNSTSTTLTVACTKRKQPPATTTTTTTTISSNSNSCATTTFGKFTPKDWHHRHYQSLIQELQKGTYAHLTHWKFYLPETLDRSCRPTQTTFRELLRTAAKHLPNLREVEFCGLPRRKKGYVISDYSRKDEPIDFADILEFFHNVPPNFTKITFQGGCYSPTNQGNIASILEKQRQLIELNVLDYRVSTYKMRNPFDKDAMLRAMEFLPNLKRVADNTPLPFPAGLVTNFLHQHPRLEELRISNTDMMEVEFIPIFVSLLQEHNTQLKVFTAGQLHVCGPTLNPIVAMIRSNSAPSLQEFRFADYIYTVSEVVDGTEQITIVADALQNNTHLRILHWDPVEKIEPAAVEAVNKMLDTNFILEQFHFGSVMDKNTEDTVQAKAWMDQIEFKCMLNRLGRNRLKQYESVDDVPRSEWIRLLSQCSHEPRCLFYYLIMNPSLCHV